MSVYLTIKCDECGDIFDNNSDDYSLTLAHAEGYGVVETSGDRHICGNCAEGRDARD